MDIVLIGSGGHAKVIIDIVQSEKKHRIVGLVKNVRSSGPKEVSGVPVIGSDPDLPYLSNEMQFNHGIICLGDNFERQRILKSISDLLPNFDFVTAIHPGASVSRWVQVGVGTVIMGGVTINTNCEIGTHCIVNTNSSIDHDSKMCDFSSIGPGVNLGGNVSIGQSSHVGIGSAVSHNVTVGENSVIGGLSYVDKDIGDQELGHSAPYRKVRRRMPGEKYL